MIVTRIYDPTPINQVVNDPDVYEWVHGANVGPLDVAALVENKNNVCVWGEHGGAIFLWQMAGIYEVHTQCLKAGRGKWMLRATQEAFHYLFTHTDAVEVVTRVPQGNLGALALAKRLSFTHEFYRPQGWIKDHKPWPVGVHSLPIQRWMGTAPELVEQGQKFHQQLEAEYIKMGKLDGTHAEDLNHDRYVGAAVGMIKGGQVGKAAVFYNRWARLSGYQEISILKADPVIIDITESILMVKGNEIKVMSCQSH